MPPTDTRADGPGGAIRFDRPGWLDDEEFPFDSRAIDVDGNRIHHVDEGTGPVLLFVHAGPAWSFVFRDVIEVLRHDYRCIAPDVPGAGLSEAAAASEPTIEHAAAVLESFVDELGVETATAVVHDVGGPVTFGVAARRPDRFAGFVVMGSFGWPLREAFPGVARFIRLVDSRPFDVVNAAVDLLPRLTATRYGVGRRLSRSGRRVFRASFASRQRRRNAIAMLASVLDSDACLERVEQSLGSELADRPVLLLFGEHDEGRKAGFQARWEARYPAVRSTVVAGARHFPMADAPHFVAGAMTRGTATTSGPPAGDASPTGPSRPRAPSGVTDAVPLVRPIPEPWRRPGTPAADRGSSARCGPSAPSSGRWLDACVTGRPRSDRPSKRSWLCPDDRFDAVRPTAG